MANDEFREDHESRRQFGKAKQHEKRLERAVRKQVAEEIATECARRAGISQRAPESMTGVREGMYVTWLAAEKLAREIGSRDPA